MARLNSMKLPLMPLKQRGAADSPRRDEGVT